MIGLLSALIVFSFPFWCVLLLPLNIGLLYPIKKILKLGNQDICGQPSQFFRIILHCWLMNSGAMLISLIAYFALSYTPFFVDINSEWGAEGIYWKVYLIFTFWGALYLCLLSFVTLVLKKTICEPKRKKVRNAYLGAHLGIVVLLIFAYILSTSTVFYPRYEFLGHDDKYGYMLKVDGEIYRTLPKTDWRPIGERLWKTTIGATNNPVTGEQWVYTYKLDTDRIFIGVGLNNMLGPYYREDITLPEFSTQGIDTIGFREADFKFTQQDYFNNTIADEIVINELFSAMRISKNLADWGTRVGTISFMNSHYFGIHTWEQIAAVNGCYYILLPGNGNPVSGAPISQELLEKIAGKKLPTAKEFIAQQSKG